MHERNAPFCDLLVFLRVSGALAGQGSSREGGRGEGKPSPHQRGLRLRPLVDGFWTDLGSILEAKLALKSMSKAIKTDVKTSIKKTSKNKPK